MTSVIRIALTGPECSGKTELANALAAHFQAPMAEEYARQYLLPGNTSYEMADLLAITKGQMDLEDEAISKARSIAIFDTDMLVMKIWALYRFGQVPFLIEQASNQRLYHLRLLCRPDLPWEPDPLRESPDPEERNLLFRLFERQLQASGAPYAIIEGEGDERLQMALRAIDEVLAH